MTHTKFFAIFFVIATVFFAGKSGVKAADTVTTDHAVGGVQKIDGDGTFSVEAGYSKVSLTMYARIGSQTTQAPVNIVNNNWAKTLNVTAGTYEVYAVLVTINNTTMQLRFTTSNTISNVVVTN